MLMRLMVTEIYLLVTPSVGRCHELFRLTIISSHNMDNELNVRHLSVLNHLQKAKYKNMFDVWVPNELNVNNKMGLFNICGTMLMRSEIAQFLK